MKLISWNLAGRNKMAARQAQALAVEHPDIVALQEVTTFSAPILRGQLAEYGLGHVVDGFEVFSPHSCHKKYRLLVASRYRMGLKACNIQLPRPECVLPVNVDSPHGRIELYACHIPPGSSNGWIKVEMLEVVYELLASPAEVPRVLCGDFNTPQQELSDGTVMSWAQRISSDGTVEVKRRMRRGSGARWDSAERRVLLGLAEFGLEDVFRRLHGYGVAEFSWRTTRKGKVLERRFDHVFAPPFAIVSRTMSASVTSN